MKRALKISFISLLTIFSTLAALGIIKIISPTMSLHLEIILVILIDAIIISPFIPRQKSKQSFFTRVLSKYKDNENETQSFRFQPKNIIELNDKYEKPIISKCKCGFILTSYTKNCPECGRENALYNEFNSKKIY